VHCSIKIDSEATIYFSPENAKPKRKLPPNVEDFDSECGTDPFQTPQYAQDIFLYFKQREVTVFNFAPKKNVPNTCCSFRFQLKFIPRRYMDQQTELTCDMRAVLVDWLVEVQESFELNHETLYSAVRLVDLYLSHTTVNKENLQLVGTTAMLISSKFEVSFLSSDPFPPFF
jgi:cyclin B